MLDQTTLLPWIYCLQASRVDMRAAIEEMASIIRIRDSSLVVYSNITEVFREVDSGSPLARDMLCFAAHDSQADMGKQIALLKRMNGKHPNNPFFMDKLCALLAFPSPYRDLIQSLRLAKEISVMKLEPDFQLEILYTLGALHMQKEEYLQAIPYFDKFLKQGIADGHRKVPMALFSKGVALVLSKKHHNNDALLSLWKEGCRHELKLPPFLRCTEGGPKATLRLYLNVVESHQELSVDSSSGQNFNSLSFCRKHRAESPLTPRLRIQHAKNNSLDFSSLQTLAERSKLRTQDRGKDLKKIDLEKLIGPRKSEVFWGHMLTCIVIEVPILTSMPKSLPPSLTSKSMQEPSWQLLIEDENRYPARMFVYSQMFPSLNEVSTGTLLRIKNPFINVSLSYSSDFVLRVDDLNTLEVLKERLELCWGCLIGNMELNCCGGCKRAAYCGKECQRSLA